MNTATLAEATKPVDHYTIPMAEMFRREGFPFLFVHASADKVFPIPADTRSEVHNVERLTPRTLRGKAYSNIYVTEAAIEFMGAKKFNEFYVELHPTLLSSGGQIMVVQSS